MKIKVLLLALLSPLVWAHDSVTQLATALQAQAEFRALLQQEKQLANFKRPLQASGYLLFSADQGLYYVLQQPVQARYRMRSDAISVQEGGLPVRHISSAELPWMSALTAVFTHAMAGQLQQLEQHFVSEFSPGANWQLLLKPKSAALRGALQEIRVSGAEFIDQIDLMDRNGDHTLIQLRERVALGAADRAQLAERW